MKRRPHEPVSADEANDEAPSSVDRIQGAKQGGEWLDDELRREYKSVLEEPVPETLLSILRGGADVADDRESEPGADSGPAGEADEPPQR